MAAPVTLVDGSTDTGKPWGPGNPFPTSSGLVGVNDLTAAVISFATTGDQVIVAAVAGQTTRVHRIRLYASAATNMAVKNGAGATLETIQFPGAGSFVMDFATRPYWTTSVNTAFILNSSVAVTVTGRIEYATS